MPPSPPPQAQVRGEGPEVGLLRQPGQAQSVVGEQRDRHAERLLAAPVGVDPGHQVVAPRPVQFPADPAVGVLQRVAVAAARGGARHRGQEQVPVRQRGLLTRRGAGRGYHPPRRPVARRVVRQHLQLVPGVEGDQVPGRPRPAKKGTQPGRREDPLDERLPQPGVVQAALVLGRQQRERAQHPRRVQAAAGVVGGPPVVALPVVALPVVALPVVALPVSRCPCAVPRDGADAAARRLGLEHVAVQVRGQRQGRHGRRVVGGAAHVDQAPAGGQPDRLARRAEPDFHLGAVRHPVDVPVKVVGEEPVALVPAVEPDLLAEQAARHAHPRPAPKAQGHAPTLAGSEPRASWRFPRRTRTARRSAPSRWRSRRRQAGARCLHHGGHSDLSPDRIGPQAFSYEVMQEQSGGVRASNGGHEQARYTTVAAGTGD